MRLASLPVRVLSAAAVVATAGCGLGGGPAAHAQPSPAPTFTLMGLDGRTHTLADYRGRAVVLNFWATWCLPCRAEIPDLESESRRHRADVVVLGVDWKESAQAARSFVTEIGATYPVLLDSDGVAYAAYRVDGLPQTFFIDSQGRVLGARQGIVSRARLDAEIAALLAGKPPPS